VTVRAFLAFDLDEATLDRVGAMEEALRASREAPARARWVARRNMHVTLRFLGEVEESAVAGLASLVATLGARPQPTFRSASYLGLPEAAHARLVALELHDGVEAMTEVAALAGEGLAPLGFAPEARAFLPHLTLARLRAPIDARRWLGRDRHELHGKATAVTLYRSELEASGPVYTALARASFAEACPHV
jgi:2'-5' RNA ligase